MLSKLSCPTTIVVLTYGNKKRTQMLTGKKSATSQQKHKTDKDYVYRNEDEGNMLSKLSCPTTIVVLTYGNKKRTQMLTGKKSATSQQKHKTDKDYVYLWRKRR